MEELASAPPEPENPSTQSASAVASDRTISQSSPLYLLIALCASIFAIEMTEMLVLSLFPRIPALIVALLDSVLLLVGVFPVLFFFLFRPLVQNATQRRRLIAELSRANEQLTVSKNQAEWTADERTRQLSTIYDVTAMSTASTDLRAILEGSLERILVLMESEIGIIQLLEGGNGLLHLAASRGLPEEAVARLERAPRGDGMAGLVMEQAKPVVVDDLDVHQGAPEPLRGLGRRAYVGVPLLARGEDIGVLSVIRSHGRPFHAEEAAMLAAIGFQLGSAVETARLIAEVQGKAALEERQRLACELHDSVTQLLYSLTLMAEAGRRLAGTGNLDWAQEHLALLGRTAEQALRETRLLIYELRPSALEQEGLIGALQQRLDAVERRAGVETDLIVEGTTSIPSVVEEGFYRIAEESLNNALKHAAATSVSVLVRSGARCSELEVTDNGIGFDPNSIADRGGLGLVSMRRRAERMGGVLEFASAPGSGSTVRVVVKTTLDPSAPEGSFLRQEVEEVAR